MKKILGIFLVLTTLFTACAPSAETLAQQTALAATSTAAAWTPTPTWTPTPIPPDIGGIVTSSGGHAANRHFVLCEVSGPDCKITSLQALSNSSGYFEFPDVPPGEYYIFYDSGHEDFKAAANRWAGRSIRVGDVEWLVDYFITKNADGTFSFSVIPGMALDQNSAYMAVYRFFAISPFIWAHTCSSTCALPEDVIPVIASFSEGKPVQVEFEVYGPFGD